MHKRKKNSNFAAEFELSHMKDILLMDNIDEIDNNPDMLHNYLYIIYGQQGILQIDYNHQQLTVQAGDLLICMPSVVIGHYMRTPDFKATVFCAGKHLFYEVLSNSLRMEPQWWDKEQYILHHPVQHLSEQRRKVVEAYLELIRAYEQAEQNPYRERILRLIGQAAASEVFGRLEQNLREDNIIPAPGNKTYGSQDQIFQRFQELLSEHGETKREVQWYASKLLLSPKYLSAVCKEVFHKTAGQCISENSIRHIQYYLVHTDMNIKEIAFHMEFPDVSFFCKYCARLLGMSPTAYRNQERQLKRFGNQ